MTAKVIKRAASDFTDEGLSVLESLPPFPSVAEQYVPDEDGELVRFSESGEIAHWEYCLRFFYASARKVGFSACLFWEEHQKGKTSIRTVIFIMVPDHMSIPPALFAAAMDRERCKNNACQVADFWTQFPLADLTAHGNCLINEFLLPTCDYLTSRAFFKTESELHVNRLLRFLEPAASMGPTADDERLESPIYVSLLDDTSLAPPLLKQGVVASPPPSLSRVFAAASCHEMVQKAQKKRVARARTYYSVSEAVNPGHIFKIHLRLDCRSLKRVERENIVYATFDEDRLCQFCCFDADDGAADQERCGKRQNL